MNRPRNSVGALTCSALLVVALTGCAIGPDYRRPQAMATMPAAYAGATNEWKVAEPRAHLPKGNWWEMFGDEELDRLETEATAANQELKAAAARFDEARAIADAARSGLFPHVNLSPSATRQGVSGNRPLNGTAAGSSNTWTYNDFVFPLDLSYEVDLWGRVRRSVESARAQEQANADDLETVKLSIEAEVATDYFTVRALDAEEELLNTSVEVFRKSLELTQNRRAGGIASDLDVAQAETVLKTTQAELPAAMLQRAQFEHALATLTGQPASTFAVTARPLDIAPPVVPPGLPSELLERRPDIAAAERRMAAANAGIGVAKAAFFPTIELNGLAGLESVNAGTLFNWSSRLWSIGPSLTMPIFDAGQNGANLRLARATYQETVANYRQTVLSAFAEVEDNLASQSLLAGQHEAEVDALQAAHKQLAVADNRYRAGLVTFLEVATAENTALSIERTVVQLRGQQLVAAVALVKSLGGGWQDPSVATQSARAGSP
ncbi:MAG TPA: efflux transporter outer membrane subunit [Verrucomicrobiae bacterium]|nr:efflux transporter outer membrane subunit [Verrucomicrobiae bacterium]